MYESIQKRLIKELDEVKISGRYKDERIISSNQGSIINVDNSKVLNFCANNYLGLASKAAAYNIVSSFFKNFEILISSSLCMS